MAKWALDTTHSEVQFKVKHLVISTVTGSFGKFDAAVEADDDTFTNAQISFSADVASISTGNEQRDGHLKSDDFFAADKFPQLTFNGLSFKQVSGEKYALEGDLTIRDITKRITLDVDFGGTIKDPWGQIKAGFEISGKINRKDFNLTWSAVTESGGLVVADEVKLHVNVEFAKVV